MIYELDQRAIQVKSVAEHWLGLNVRIRSNSTFHKQLDWSLAESVQFELIILQESILASGISLVFQ